MQTSYFNSFKDAGRISIARSSPRWAGVVPAYRALAPGVWFKETDITRYRELYFAQLDKLNPHQVVEDLTKLAGGAEPVLLCWESLKKPGEWCHRRMVAEWLWDSIKLNVPERGSQQGSEFNVAAMF